MTITAPPWQAHSAPDFDEVMGARCVELLAQIISDRTLRLRIVADPRSLHRDLFLSFAPPTHLEYAGTYRGTPATALESRRMSAPSELGPEAEVEFVVPSEVPARMQVLLDQTSGLLADLSDDATGTAAIRESRLCCGAIGWNQIIAYDSACQRLAGGGSGTDSKRLGGSRAISRKAPGTWILARRSLPRPPRRSLAALSRSWSRTSRKP